MPQADATTSDTTPRSPHRWYQFSLWTLLVFVSVSSVGFGWLGIKLEQRRRERLAIAEIEKLGGYVISNEDETPDAWRSDSFRKWFPPAVRSVFLSTPVSDLSPLVKLHSLQGLTLNATQVKDLTALRELKSLRSLVLNNPKVSDLSVLSQLPNLEELALSDTQVSDLSILVNLRSLFGLHLIMTPVSDLSPLVKLPSLRALYLYKTQVKDFSPLAEFKGLHYLYLDDTQSEEPVQVLQKALPNWVILRVRQPP